VLHWHPCFFWKKTVREYPTTKFQGNGVATKIWTLGESPPQLVAFTTPIVSPLTPAPMLVVVVVASFGVIFPVGGTIMEYWVLKYGFWGEIRCSYWTSDGGTIGDASSLEAPLVVVWEAWMASVQRQRRCARSMCWRQGAEGPWVLEVLSWHARCNGSQWRLGGSDAPKVVSDIWVFGRGVWGGGRGEAPTHSGRDLWF
jgi:hypothetical protein